MQTLVVPLLPDFPRILGVTADDASWLVTATLLSSAVATPIVSRSADMYGKRKMMVVCLAIMVAGSVIAAVGGSFLWLIIGRALQGFSSALIPVGISIMRDELPKEKMGSAVALMSATLGIGSAMGLPLAGVLYESLGWASIFWVSAAAGTLLLAGRAAGGSRIQGPHARALRLRRGRGAVRRAGGPAAGHLQGRLLGLGLRAGPAAVPGAAVLLAMWVPYELKVSQPMVDLRTSARRPVLMTNLASLLIGFAMFANMLLTTQQLQLPAVHRLRLPAERHHGRAVHGPVRTRHGDLRTRFRPPDPCFWRQDRADCRRCRHDCRLRGPRLLLRLHRLGHYRFHSGQHRNGHRLRRHAHPDHGRRCPSPRRRPPTD